MRTELEWAVRLPVPCPACGEETLEAVAELSSRGQVICPQCGGPHRHQIGCLAGIRTGIRAGRGKSPGALSRIALTQRASHRLKIGLAVERLRHRVRCLAMPCQGCRKCGQRMIRDDESRNGGVIERANLKQRAWTVLRDKRSYRRRDPGAGRNSI
jgi:hypothetical protein